MSDWPDELREAIDQVAQGVARIRESGISDRALHLLIQHAAPTVRGKRPTMAQIEAVLEGLEAVEAFVFGGEDE